MNIHPERMEDLPTKSAPTPPQPKTQTKLPQISTAERRRNQAGQPRTGEGKYANKPPSKWKAFLPGQPTQPTPLNKVSKPARPLARQPLPRPVRRKKTRTLAPMESMMDRHPIVKVHWWVTRGFRQWRRRKAKALRTLFSLKG